MVQGLLILLCGIAIGAALDVPWLKKAEPPEFIWRSEMGGRMKVTPANTHKAIDMAGVYCKGFGKYPVLTETTVTSLGSIRFDCITHMELTGPLARPPTP